MRTALSRWPAPLLLAVSTYPPMLPRGVVTQLVESALLWSVGLLLGWWLAGRRVGPAGTPTVVVVAAWLAVTLGSQDAAREALGTPAVGWAPAVVAGTAVLLGARVLRGGGLVSVLAAGSLTVALVATAVTAVAAPLVPPSSPPAPAPRLFGVHVAVALSAGSATERAQTAVRELAARGGLARGTLAVVVPTGSGWVDPAALAALDAATGGDVATVSLAYDDAPSWRSYLTARDRAVDTTGALLAAVDRVRGDRPVLLYGQSLGALAGAAAWARHPDRADGALWVGPPADAVTTPAAGRPVEVLVHPDDPAAVWSPRLLVTPSPAVPGWLPGVSFLQTSVDLLAATGVPAGHGHHYGPEQRAGWDRLLRAARARGAPDALTWQDG